MTFTLPSARYTCPFVEKFSIDIETFYKTDTGENNNVFNLSPVEKSQLITGEREGRSSAGGTPTSGHSGCGPLPLPELLLRVHWILSLGVGQSEAGQASLPLMCMPSLLAFSSL